MKKQIARYILFLYSVLPCVLLPTRILGREEATLGWLILFVLVGIPWFWAMAHGDWE